MAEADPSSSGGVGCSRTPPSSSCPDDLGDTMDGGVAVEDFINTGRTGRRNAVADINDQRVAGISTAGMDFSFDQLSVADSKPSSADNGKETNSESTDKSQSASKS